MTRRQLWKYRLKHAWKALRQGEPMDVDPGGHRMVCLICSEPLDPQTGEREGLQTFSFGDNAEDAFCAGVVCLCEEHRVIADWTRPLAGRIGVIALNTGALTVRNKPE